MRRTYRPRPLREQSSFRRALAIADTEEFAAITRALTATTGRRKAVPYRAAIVALLLHGIRGVGPMWLTSVADTLCSLGRRKLDELGVTSSAPMNSIQEALTKLAEALTAGLVVTYPDGTTTTLRVDDFTALVRLGIPAGYKVSKSVALDGMDYPSWAVQRDHVDTTTGEIWPSADPGAAIGHRTSTPSHDSKWYCGREINLACTAAEHGNPLIAPHLVVGMAIRSGTQDRGPAGSAAVLQAARHFNTTEVLADRGYTQLTPTSFWLPLFEHGIRIVHDLKSQQRGARSASVPGVIIVDGHPFSAAMPANLRKLTPPKLSDPAQEQERIRRLYDKRAAYAFTPHSRLDPNTGAQRFKGPARTGHLRCPNVPSSMRLPRDRPLATCKKGDSCSCGSVITLPLGDDAHLRQRWLYGTTAWKHAYSRRVAIESVNAEARTHRGHIDRGFTRVHGNARTAILLTFAYIGLNVRILNDWYETRGLDDPWSTLVEDPEDDRIRQPLANPDRLTIRDRLTAGSDPPTKRTAVRS